MIAKFFENLLGQNWKTSLWGGITIVAMLVAAQPDSVAFLPDEFERYIKGLAAFITLLTGGKFVANIKDKDVTGGTIASTNEAEKRVNKDQGITTEKVLEVSIKTETVKADKKDK